MKVNEENLKQEIAAVKAELIILQEVAVQEPITKQPDCFPVELPEKTVSMYTNGHACTQPTYNTNIYSCMCIHMHERAHPRTHARTNAHTQIHMYIIVCMHLLINIIYNDTCTSVLKQFGLMKPICRATYSYRAYIIGKIY